MKIKLDKDNILAAMRTAGALIIGNVFVAYAILNKRDWLDLGALLGWGIFVILVASPSKESK